MKKILFPLVFIATLAMGFKLTMTDEEKAGLGRVQKVNGIEVYIMCEPLRPYDIVEDVSVYDAGVSQNYVDDWVGKYVKKAWNVVHCFDCQRLFEIALPPGGAWFRKYPAVAWKERLSFSS